MASLVTLFSSFFLAVLVALTVQILFFSPIDPVLLDLKPSTTTRDNKLQNIIKLGDGHVKEPEDLCVDKEGTMYTATRDGWIKRMLRNGNWENWKYIGGDTLIGVTESKEGGIIVCDSDRGLLRVREDGISVLTSHANDGSEIRFADDAIEDWDGNVYFSIVSTKFDMHHWHLDFLEARPHGQLFKYTAQTNESALLLDNLAFANGVALSKDQDFLLICETWRYRCLRYWLKGENKGKTDIFVENLPGAPDNINLAPDGSFWIGLIQLNSERLEFMYNYKITKHLIASSPRLFNFVADLKRRARVVNVGTDGKIIRKLEDSNGKVINFVTSALEFEDNLYFGSLSSNFVGKLPLNAA
ncbi:protein STRICTOSIDINE SYNTHASE-LIKE 4-like [Vigna unguiculata]|uniref:Simple sugar transport system permease protein n=1 Tax=Vigna unguiculata TaxID=3917 RepID=A0A4D6NKW7_VIGUN|nr:protein STRICTOSIDINE SYNTHASE-LIKE 4-like [Vigna unguiculata]QCE13581.1 simple sugar transport system permease protein [Vigna unguiculata]